MTICNIAKMVDRRKACEPEPGCIIKLFYQKEDKRYGTGVL